MQKTIIEVSGYQVTAFERAAEAISGDDYLVIQLPDRIRLAAFDGVSPTQETPVPIAERGDSFASGVLRASFRKDASPEKIAHECNDYLQGFSARTSRDYPQAVAVVADIYHDHISMLRAGDCEIWLKENDEFENVFHSPAIEEPHRSRYLDWVEANLDAPADTHLAAQERLLGKAECWSTTSIGRFPKAKLETKTIKGDWQEIILASDGAFLNKTVVKDLEKWRGWVLEQRRDTRHKRQDDLVLLSCKKLEPAEN